MEVVDAIAALTIVNAGNSFENLPVIGSVTGDSVKITQLVRIGSVAVLTTTAATAADRILNYLEQRYPEFISPAGSVSGVYESYQYRFYPGTMSVAGISEGHVYYWGSASGYEFREGSLDYMLNLAVAAGY